MAEQEASPRKLQKAREEGNSGASSYATSAIAFVVVVALLPAAGRLITARTTGLIRAAIAHAGDQAPSVAIRPSVLAGEFLAMALPLLAVMAAVAAVVSGVQAGGVIAFQKLKPKFPDVTKGVKNLFSTQRVFGVVRSLIAATAVSYLVYRGLKTHALDLARTTGNIAGVGPLAAEIARSIAWDAALLGLGLGVVDAVVTKLKWLKDLRMKPEEAKREHKESEGDPHIKHERKRAHRDWLAADALNQVRNANVVVVNPTHLACALKYQTDEGDEAPTLICSGRGDFALQIRKAAQAYGVPIVHNIPLARALIELSQGDAIPEELYEAVAEILRAAWEEEQS
jgi:type III secretion protein U